MKRQLIALYLLCAAPLGIFMALAVPPGQAPDEPAHMARAEGLLHGAVMTVRKQVVIAGVETQETGVKVDSGLFAMSFGKVTQIGGHGVETLADYNTLRAAPPWHTPLFVYICNTGPYFPAAYLPATFGLALGLALGISPFDGMILARLCMLAACLALGSLALRIAAHGEALLLCVLLTPMTLSLAGSLNQDGMLISMACVSAAAMTRDFSKAPKYRWAALLPLVLILGSKPPYLPLLGLALLPLGAPGFWRRVRDMALAMLPVLGWVALITAFVIVPLSRGPYYPGPLFTGDRNVIHFVADTHISLHILLADPLRFITLPAQLMRTSWWLLLNELIGILGWMNLEFPQRFYIAWTIALVTALVGLIFTIRREKLPPPRIWQLPYVLLLLILAAWGVAISMYLTWTEVGSATIDGVQGRYFLPLLPFLLLAVPQWRSRFNLSAIVPALPALALGIYDLGYVPLKVVAFYYMY